MLEQQLLNESWNMQILLRNPEHAFIYQLNSLTNLWDMFSVVQAELAQRDAEAYSDRHHNPILLHTRPLHRAISQVISLREDLRRHVEVFQRFQAICEKDGLIDLGDSMRPALNYDTGERLGSLRRAQDRMAVLHSQFENLLSLVSPVTAPSEPLRLIFP